MKVTWQNPPPDARKQRVYQYQPIIDVLRANPGEWARIQECHPHPGLSGAIKSGGCGFRGGFEATSRRVDGGFDIYARYVGPNGEYR